MGQPFNIQLQPPGTLQRRENQTLFLMTQGEEMAAEQQSVKWQPALPGQSTPSDSTEAEGLPAGAGWHLCPSELVLPPWVRPDPLTLV